MRNPKTHIRLYRRAGRGYEEEYIGCGQLNVHYIYSTNIEMWVTCKKCLKLLGYL